MTDGNAASRAGLRMGQASEFTIIAKLKEGGANRMREFLKDGFVGDRRSQVDRIGTVHDLRFVILDDDTRLLFASTFDGGWESYIDDFSTIIPDEIDLVFHELEGYPGVRAPGIKEWIAERQVTALGFYSAYPDATVRDVRKALAVRSAFETLLDTVG